MYWYKNTIIAQNVLLLRYHYFDLIVCCVIRHHRIKSYCLLIRYIHKIIKKISHTIKTKTLFIIICFITFLFSFASLLIMSCVFFFMYLIIVSETNTYTHALLRQTITNNYYMWYDWMRLGPIHNRLDVYASLLHCWKGIPRTVKSI